MKASLDTVREVLIFHLGSLEAADVWLNSTETGYPTTAMDAILEGKAELVIEDLHQQWGPSSAYG